MQEENSEVVNKYRKAPRVAQYVVKQIALMTES
jgi:hypothetical protein